MGDDELNFTDEEARCWADDPRNQAQEEHLFPRVFIVSLLVALAIIVFALLAGFHSSAIEQRSQQEEHSIMPTKEVTVIEEDLPETPGVPEVEVRGEEAVIRIENPVGVEERKVKLPKATWG